MKASHKLHHALRSALLRYLLACGVALAVASPLWAHDDHHHDDAPPRRDAKAEYGPTEQPDRIVLTWTGDPATTQAVTWRTSANIERGYAEIAVVTQGPRFRDARTKHTAESQSFETDLGDCRFHTVEFKGLTPNTKYAYRVGDDVNWSEWFHFRTASDKPDPFSFVYFGDAQNEVRSMWSRIVREAFSDAPRAAFMLHAGDLINDPTVDAEWGEWFHAGSWINAHIPVIATPGNHEYTRRRVLGIKTTKMLSPYWQPQFAFPTNGPKTLSESAYTIDYQGVRIISLNSNEQVALQQKWLRSVLKSNDNAWTIATFHHPVYPMAGKRGGVSNSRVWMETFDEFGVDLVLTGHDHTYGRSELMAMEKNLPQGVNWRSEKGGTVYVVSVSGPKMYDVDDKMRERMAKTGEQVQLYQIIHIDGKTLRYEARSADGVVFDAFELHKQADGKNVMRTSKAKG